MKVNHRILWLLLLLRFLIIASYVLMIPIVIIGYFIGGSVNHGPALYLLTIFQIITGIAGIIPVSYSKVITWILVSLLLFSNAFTFEWQLDMVHKFKSTELTFYIPAFCVLSFIVWLFRTVFFRKPEEFRY